MGTIDTEEHGLLLDNGLCLLNKSTSLQNSKYCVTARPPQEMLLYVENYVSAYRVKFVIKYTDCYMLLSNNYIMGYYVTGSKDNFAFLFKRRKRLHSADVQRLISMSVIVILVQVWWNPH